MSRSSPRAPPPGAPRPPRAPAPARPRRPGRRWPASPLGMKVFRRKALLLCAGYALLLGLTALNLLDYRWHREAPPRPCGPDGPGAPRRAALPPRAPPASPPAPPPPANADNRTATRGPPGRAGPRQLVYVLTTWRSGSSFFGELFNQHPDVFFLYEPVWHVWQKLYPGDAVSLQGAARDMLSALYRCDLSVFQLYGPAGGGGRNLTTLGIFGAATNKVVCSAPLCPAYRKEVVALVDDRVCKKCPPQRLARLEAECRRYRALAIKGVRVFDVAVLAPLLRDPALDLKVVHLVRDPRAVAASRIRSRHGLIRESLQVVRSRDPRAHRAPPAAAAAPRGHRPGLGGGGARKEGAAGGPADYHALGAMEVICHSMAATLQTALRPPDWLRGRYLAVRYEDLVGDPVRTLRRVYAFVGLPVSAAMEQFALNMTSGPAAAAKPFVVSARNATQAASAWRSALSFAQVRQVEEFCAQPMAVLGYERARGPEDVRDLSKPLLRKPRL
ncbi:LOW QUALITY PROTEIN: carbohydrate sulfotransferase 2 [Dipodomys spectabilis]|uniref:LOW QUALITY PROTEIN: carbohydrate sulfotransferase 2 n=1 Tax=Dipodomys spectabilis TaxID=105255 RepID=UPI001C5352BE|nr:LOW QUALITY PROTEIN: carbohydrate sulfotransferase 2 [Dipodomys spectabilis]